MKIALLEVRAAECRLTWPDGSSDTLPWIWLRDNDPDDLHPHTRERTFDLTSVALDIEPQTAAASNEGLRIRWPDKGTESLYPIEWLRAHRPGQCRSDPADVVRKTWDRDSLGAVPRFGARACHDDPATLLEALQTAKRTGLALIDGLGSDEDAAEAFAGLIGFYRQTNFGAMFEVLNKPDPNNLAYTALALPLHTDLPNQEAVPGYQLLHCCRNDAAGGASVFADGFRICADLRRDDPDAFDLLSQLPVPWRFHDEVWDIRRHRPMIELSASGNFRRFVFNAHIADVPDLPAGRLVAFYAAYQNLMRRVRDPRYAIEQRLVPGEMAIFDNQRVLHGRTAFDPTSGERYLRGCYIEHNEIDSRIRVLARQSDAPESAG